MKNYQSGSTKLSTIQERFQNFHPKANIPQNKKRIHKHSYQISTHNKPSNTIQNTNINNYIKIRQPPNQKQYHQERIKRINKNSRGCKEQMIIEQNTTNYTRNKKKDLFCAFTDYRKSFDSIPLLARNP